MMKKQLTGIDISQLLETLKDIELLIINYGIQVQVKLYNLATYLIARLRGYPLRCSGDHPGYSKDYGCSVEETFVCSCCQRITPYCKGQLDDYPDICDDCWVDISIQVLAKDETT